MGGGTKNKWNPRTLKQKWGVYTGMRRWWRKKRILTLPLFFYSRLHAEKNGPPSCDQHEDDSVEKKRSNLIDMVDKHLAIENSQHCQKKKKKKRSFPSHTHTHRRPFRSWLDFSFLVVWTFLYAVVFSYRECVCVLRVSNASQCIFIFLSFFLYIALFSPPLLCRPHTVSLFYNLLFFLPLHAQSSSRNRHWPHPKLYIHGGLGRGERPRTYMRSFSLFFFFF